MTHAARQLRSWLIFDVRRNERIYSAACGAGGDMSASLHAATFGVRALLLHAGEGISSRVGGLREPRGGSIRRVVKEWNAIAIWRIRTSLPRSVLRSGGTGRVNRTHSWISVGSAVWPNKAPEPTPTAVTPRASLRMMKMKQLKVDRHVARGAPAAVVAHL
jgi:hypothetical protein